MIIGMLLIVLCLITLWLTSPRRRRLVRWHFQRVSVLSYQDWLDAMLSVIQMSIVVLVLFGYSARLNLGDFLPFLGRLTWSWQFLVYMVLYLLALIEITLVVLVLLFDLVLQKDSRLLLRNSPG